jgi:hypothetical protein
MVKQPLKFNMNDDRRQQVFDCSIDRAVMYLTRRLRHLLRSGMR